MQTLTELKNTLGENHIDYYDGYQDAIEGILKDIQEAEVISVDSIEKYLEKLLK